MKKLTTVICLLFAFAIVAAQSFSLTYYQEYDEKGNITCQKFANGYETVAEYDKNGQQTYIKSTLNGETETEVVISYHNNGEIKTCKVKEYDEEWFYELDKKGNTVYLKEPTGIEYYYDNDKYGRLMYATSSDGALVFFAYTDDASYAKYIYDNEETFYTFDANGNIISQYTKGEPISRYDLSDYSYQQQDTDYNEEIDAEYDYNDYHDDMDYAEDYGYYEEKDRHGNI
ncbi:MAG: hypothetical protein K5930_08515, partial [Treponemataceae bacterium]|nr:hypothetical protein [Treponemataceae bacterium]